MTQQKITKILRLYNIEKRIFGELLQDLINLDNWISVENKDKLPKNICECYVYVPDSLKGMYRVVSVYPHLKEFELFPVGTTHFQYCEPPKD